MNASRLAFVGTLLSILTVLGIPPAARATQCHGKTRLQLRWSARTHTAIVSFSATDCARPATCDLTKRIPTGSLVTASPLTVTITDSDGKTLSGALDAADPACGGRCRRINRGGCPNGVDTHRTGGSFVRYSFGKQGEANVVGSKLNISSNAPPDLTAPVTISVRDANGYSVEAQMSKCRSRKSARGAAVTCL